MTSRRLPLLLIAVLALALVLALAACDDTEPTPTPTQTPTSTVMPEPIPTPSPVPTATPTQTATPTPVPTATPTATPTPIPDPSIESFAAIPLTIEDGDSGTLNWTTTGASSVTISGVGGTLPVDGTTIIRPTTTTTYTLTATNEAGTEVSESVTVTVTYPIVSLDVSGTTILDSMGGTSQLSITATRSDGSSYEADNSLVEWESSDAWVATVSQGMVTAVGGGNAVIAATHEGRTVEASVSVRISTRSSRAVRVIYAVPSDREFRPDYSEGVSNAIVDLQSWYRREMGGLTFSLYEATPEECRMSQPAEYYGTGHAWDKIEAALQHCAPVQHNHPDFVWVVYADVEESCGEPHELGAGGWGLTILPSGDLEGLTNPGPYYHCDEGPYSGTLGRWIGGLGHELSHAFRLPHPPGCDAGLPTCDHRALISGGYASYPETYLRADNKEVLIRSPFLGTEPVPGRDPADLANASKVSGRALGPDDEPLQGVRVSLAGEDFWNWGEASADGSFVIPVPEGASGPSLLSVHAGKTGECGWLGYHGPDRITTERFKATWLDVGDEDVSGIEIRLPAVGNNPCLRERKVAGVVLGPDGRPVGGIWLGAFDEWLRVGRDGAFEFSVPEIQSGSTRLRIDATGIADCGLLGYYGPGGFTTWREEASLEIGGIGAPGIEIRLPASPAELCRGQPVVAGTVLGPDDEPIEGFWIGLIDAEPRGFWPRKWGETGPNGTFEIRLLAGQTSSFVVRIYADEEGISTICNQLGYYGPGGFTAIGGDATVIEVGDTDATGIQIRLPASPKELLPARVGAYYCGV